MPFDAMPEVVVSDVARLRVALDGVRNGWARYHIGLRGGDHCALGWLLEAADWDRDEAVRLALKYVYPALPASARHNDRLVSIYRYNDFGSHRRIERLFADACRLAEEPAVR